jgi:elongation factor P--(R)-beta-lysine ligase
LSRSNFLTQIWKPYPWVRESDQSLFSFGRVVSIDPTGLTKVVGPQGDWQFNGGDVTEIEHEHFGMALPFVLLQRQDIIAFDRYNQVIYLLVPGQDLKGTSHDAPLLWNQFIEQVHLFFREQGFTHITTPSLVRSPGVDQHIDFMEVKGVRTGRTWYLPTSPEISLKKYLCQDHHRIYEVKNCFRDDLEGPLHTPEFTMLEWYRTFTDLEAIKADIKGLLAQLLPVAPEIPTYTVAQLFMLCTGRQLTPTTGRDQLWQWASELGLNPSQDDDWNDLFFRIYMAKVETHLAQQEFCFIENFPRQQASLAQINSQGWAQRFELYWQGVELANAYLELNDPNENRLRFQQEQRLREERGAPASGWDEDFFLNLDHGLPPASGVALGLSRLYRKLKNA